ncbi:FkbM family methyltransferase [Chroococcidiopsis sp.]|uniref:FkbM family methyltransferase n=1 Tax=Chroococcidiopsis sp. TaxID=3088168 RepID=UPI003F3388B7
MLSHFTQYNRTSLEKIASDNTKSHYLGDAVLCHVLAKYWMYVDPENADISPHLIARGYWEMWITIAIARILQPGWYCIDVGANMGYYSCLMADAVGSSGKVLAVEANPRNTNLLKKTAIANGFKQLEVVNYAACDEDDSLTVLEVPPMMGGSASIMSCHKGATTIYELEVETTTLDKLIDARSWERVDFIKIDAEGAEGLIWEGMQKILTANPNIQIVMEFEPSRYLHPRGFLESIQSAGFELQFIDFVSQIQPITLEQCLEQKDWLMLYLSRAKND